MCQGRMHFPATFLHSCLRTYMVDKDTFKRASKCTGKYECIALCCVPLP